VKVKFIKDPNKIHLKEEKDLIEKVISSFKERFRIQ